MDNMDYLLQYVLPWARQNREPVEDITFRCFLHIERNAGLLSRYNMLLASRGATPDVRRNVNREIAQRIEKELNLERIDERELPEGYFLINSYSRLKEKQNEN